MYRNVAKAFALIVLASSAASAASISDTDKSAVTIKLQQNIGPEFATIVQFRDQRIKVRTLIPEYESDKKVVESERARSGWKGDYLFVRQRCNGLNDWRCVVDHVFTINAGRLVRIGEVESSGCEVAGCRFEAGRFTDIFDGMQVNPVTGRQDAGPLEIVRRVEANQLVTDGEMTWQRNASQYRQAVTCLEQTGRQGFDIPCELKQQPWSSLVYAAKLTHYTRRGAEWQMLFDQLAPRYCAKSRDPACMDRVAGLKDHVARLAPTSPPIFVPFQVIEMVGDGESASTLPAADQMAPAKIIQLKP